MFNKNAQLLHMRVTIVTLKSCNLIGCSRILERVQLDVHEVTKPFFSWRLKGVACETTAQVASASNPMRLPS